MLFYAIVEFPNSQKDLRFGPFSTFEEAMEYSEYLASEYEDGWTGVVPAKYMVRYLYFIPVWHEWHVAREERFASYEEAVASVQTCKSHIDWEIVPV